MERNGFKFIALFLIWGFVAQDILTLFDGLINRLIEFYVFRNDLGPAKYRIVWLMINLTVFILFVTSVAIIIKPKREFRLSKLKVPKFVISTVIAAVFLRFILYWVYQLEWNNFNFYFYLTENREVGSSELVIIPKFWEVAPRIAYSLAFISFILIINKRLKKEELSNTR